MVKAQELAKKILAKSVPCLWMTKEAVNQNTGEVSLEFTLYFEVSFK